MKTCPTCQKLKPLSDFNRSSRNSDGKQTSCRQCQSDWYKRNREHHIKNVRERAKTWRATVAVWKWEYLAHHPCVDCGEADPVVLEFDHVRDTKYRGLARLQDVSISKLEEEVAKCEVRCANCHRRRTAQQFGHYAFVAQRQSGRL